MTPTAHYGLTVLASETELYIAKVPIYMIRKKYSDANHKLPMPHKLFAVKFRDAQLDIATNIQDILRIPQLQGDVELLVPPLENEHNVNKFFESTYLAEEVEPQGAKAKEEKVAKSIADEEEAEYASVLASVLLVCVSAPCL